MNEGPGYAIVFEKRKVKMQMREMIFVAGEYFFMVVGTSEEFFSCQGDLYINADSESLSTYITYFF